MDTITTGNRDCKSCKYAELSPLSYPCNECGLYDGHSAYEPKEENNPVSHPNHYQSKSGLEVIDVIRAFTEDCDGVESYYTGNILKYMCRWKKKNGLEDLQKARQYLDWLIEMKKPSGNHPHHSGPKPFSEMTEEDAKRELNRIYGLGIFDDFKNFWNSLPDDTKEYARSLAKEEKKEPPKNGRYSMSDDDCFIPWQIRPQITPPYPIPESCDCCCGMVSDIKIKDDKEWCTPKDIADMVWTEFCRVFCESLKKVSEEKEKENKKDEK